MTKLDKGTLIRTVVLGVAFLNQILVMFDMSPLPIESEELEQFLALLFTIASSIIAWFKNNYITKKGRQQRDVLKEKGLAK
ncbi:phage holin [Aquibacillus sp. 3ASR75-11]|uniref:Phage holin n=1 Tax=Terrihalobacillus insolitus TaxID=2950438 RepID=A0A9X4AKY4_9BACI|nr:phage holin [Terrihalobacillus insolitus]MDC3412721.1 phage holin [Terrihalobacillus insolitus]MDC3423802.1 phage holin [Terrihalobacillus insolitus]